MYLEKNYVNNNGHHTYFTIKTKFNLFKKINKFGYKSNIHRNKVLSKSRSLRSQKNVAVRFSLTKVYQYNNIRLLSFSLQFILNKVNNKVSVLFCTSNGMFYYFLSSSTIRLFRYYKNVIKRVKLKKKIKRFVKPLFMFRRLSKVCLIGKKTRSPNIFCKAPGAYSLVNSFNKKLKLVTLILPSKDRIFINWFTLVNSGKIKKF